MNIKEAAEALGVSRPTIYRLIRDGKLTRSRHPLYEKGPWRIPRAEVEVLARQVREARPPYG